MSTVDSGWPDGGDGSASAHHGASDAAACAAWCWIARGLAGLLCFAPFGLAARRWLPPKVCAHSAMVFAQVVFGAGTVLVGGDMKAHPIDPVVFALVREAMAALALGVAAAALERTLPRAADLPRIFCIGLGVWGTNLLFIFGVKWVSQADAAAVGTLMQPCLPVVTTLLAVLLGFERSNPAKLGGIAVAIAGSVLVVALGQLDAGPRADGSGSAGEADGARQKRLLLQGTGTLLCQAFCNAAYILLQRKLLQPPRSFPVLTLTAAGFAVAAACMTVFSAVTPGWHRRSPSAGPGGWDLPTAAWLPIAYWVFAGSCVAYSCCSFANSVLPASVVAAYTCLQPLVGVVFSWFLLGERLAWRDLGGVLIIAGLLLTSLGAKADAAAPAGQHVQGEAAAAGRRTPLLPKPNR
jgi:drug/metabolite transporter (DMT)-like permease